MNVINISEEAFFSLVETVLAKIKADNLPAEPVWLTSEQAMKKLNIKSKTTLAALRNEGHIRYTQPKKKLIQYCSKSINEYLEKSSKKPF